MIGSRGAWAFAFCASLVCVPLHAAELSRQHIALTYDVEAALVGCPSALEFQALIAKELGYDPHRADAKLEVGVRIRATSSGIEGTIAWSKASGRTVGERRFSAHETHCRQMTSSMGFALAVQLQLMASEQPTESTASGGPEDPISDAAGPLKREGSEHLDRIERVVSLKTLSFRARPVQNPQEGNWSTSLGVGVGIGAGLAPMPLGQGRAFASVRRKWFGLELGVEATASSTKRQDYGAGFQHELRLGSLATCYWQGPLAACGLVKSGRIQVQGSGVDLPASPRGFMAQTGPRLGYELGLGRHWVVLGHVEVLWLLTPWTVDVNHQPVWVMPRIASLVGFDIAARFP